MRKCLTILTAAIALAGCVPAYAANTRPVPLAIYEWVHSTARAGYYFNKQQMNYAVGEDGFIDLNTLVVPVFEIYDDVQISDVVAKRRWKMLPTEGYGDLVGCAEYLRFDLGKGTVTITEKSDLDSTWSPLATEKPNTSIEIAALSEQNVDRRFYEAIIKYAEEHRDELIKRSRGTLSDDDKAKLAAAQEPSADKKDGDKKDKKDNKDKKDKQDKKDKDA